MKAVIVELRNNYASVLSDDGCIRKIKNNSYQVGQVINMTIARNNMLKKITMFAASAAAILIFGVGTWAYASPYSYVSLDVNPSVEYVLNRFDRVLKVKAGNEDGESILQEIKLENLKNETIVNAINKTLSQIYDMGYLSDDTEGGIVIATSNKDTKKAVELYEDIKEDIEDEIHESYDTASVEFFNVGMERVEAARELGVTPGKLNLVEKMIESSDDPQSILLEEWLDKPVKDIMKATKENKEDDIEDDLLSDSNDDKSVKEAVKEARIAAKEADKAAKEAEKEAKRAAREAEKEAKKAAKSDSSKTDEKALEDEIDEANELKKLTEEAAKEAREAAKEAEKAAKEAEKAEKRARDAERQKDDKSIKEAEKEAKKAAKKAEKAAKEALKALEKAKPEDKPDGHANSNNKNNSKDNDNRDKNKGNKDNDSGKRIEP